MKKPWIVVTRKITNDDAPMPRAVTKQIWAAGLDAFSQEPVMAPLSAANIVHVLGEGGPLTPLW